MGSSAYVFAQEEEIEDKLQARVKAKADERYEEYSFSPAIDIYKKVLDKGYTSPDLLKRLANSYYFNAKYEEAANIYKKLVEYFNLYKKIGHEICQKSTNQLRLFRINV